VANEISGRLPVHLPTFAALMLGCLVSMQMYSQVVGGTVSGMIFNLSGEAVPSLQISIRNAATGVTTIARTDADGLYNAPNLLPGSYDITMSAPGYETEGQRGVTLTVGGQQVLNLVMKAGTAIHNAEAIDATPAMQLITSTISAVVDSATILDLPLNGRSWTDLAALQPGVSAIRTVVDISSADRLGRGLGVQLTVSGGRPQQNNYLVNGISINDHSNQAPGSVLGSNLGVDAIEEFSVLTTNYSTEYGRASGGVISAIARSGTNRFHGGVYEFLRNSALDAANFFDNAGGLKKPSFRRNQFGGSGGGPIRKDKTFIFGDYEGLRQALGLSEVDTVPSLAARSGNLCNPPDCSTTTNVGVNPLVKPFLGFYPLPNGRILCPFTTCTPGAGDTAVFSFGGSQNISENYFTVRIDRKISERNNLSGTYTFDNAPSSQNDEFNNKVIFTKTRRQLLTLEENHIFSPILVNSLRVGFNRVFAASPNGSKAVNPLATDTSLGFVRGESSGNIGVPGLTFFTGGLSTTQPQEFCWNSWQAYDNVFLTQGIHSLKFGANVERIEDNSFSSSRPGGDFEFNSLGDFLTNNFLNPTDALSITTDLPVAVTPRGLRETIFGAYLQDDARLRPNLTLNLGIRYEMATVPTEVQGKLAALVHLTDAKPKCLKAPPTQPQACTVGSPLFANPSLLDFEPRVGFSWDPFRDGRTAVRGGFGVFDVQIMPLNLRNSVDGTLPFALEANGAGLPPGSFPSAAFASLSTDPASERANHIEQNPPRNYVFQWNLNVQRQLGRSTTATIAYVGSRAVHDLFQADDVSIVLPTRTPQGYLWPSPVGSGQILNPNFHRIPATLWNSSSIYHGLQLQVSKRMSHGFRAQGSYTWAKSIDTSSGSTDGDQFQNGISSLFFFDQKLRRGLSDFNVGQNLTVSYTWDIPRPKSLSGVGRWALGGLEFGGIYQASGGVPFTPIIGGDPLGLNNTDPFDFPNRLTSPGCQSLVNPGNPDNYIKLNCFALPTAPASLAPQCTRFVPGGLPNPPTPGTCSNLLGNSGRNILIGPGLSNFDMSLLKNNPIKKISESFNAQFRLEVFNIFNRANFKPPTGNNTLFDGSGGSVPGAGLITQTATTSRQIQFALKLIW
jgi:hypothetical protein